MTQEHKEKKNRRAGFWKFVLYGVCALIFAFVCFSAYKYIHARNEYKTGGELYRNMSDFVSSVVPSPTPAPTAGPEASAEPLPTPERAPITVDWDSLRSVNSDVIGWIYCEGTQINYPVAKCDNNDYYLTHLFNGKYNSCGTIFMDCGNDAKLGDRNTVLYGHNMRDGSMFHSITEYENQDYYDEHPVLYFLTPWKNYRVDLFSAHDSWLDSYGYNVSFASDSDYADFLSELTSDSDFTAAVKPAVSDRILTLSTCAYSYNNERYVLHGILVPID